MSHLISEDFLLKKNIAIVGLGYVGLPLALAFGKSRKVLGFDLNPKRIDQLSKGVDQNLEHSYEDIKSANFLSFSNNSNDLFTSSIFFITVPTPITKANIPDLGPLTYACEIVGKHLKVNDVVIIESTVYPGTTEEICVPILKKLSGLDFINEVTKKNISTNGFFAGYSPERINPGDKIRKFKDIVKVVSGSTKEISIAIDYLYKEVLDAGTHLAPSIKVAEAAKIIENTQRDLNVAFMNELSILFSKLNIDTNEVLRAAKTKWNFLDFKPGLVGGHCIGVDPYYLKYKAEMVDYHLKLVSSARLVNDMMPEHLCNQILKQLISLDVPIKSIKICILGVSFKPNCSDSRNSKVFVLMSLLSDWGIECNFWDPLIIDDDKNAEPFKKIETETELYKNKYFILAVAHDEIINSLKRYINKTKHKKKKIIFDLYGELDNTVSSSIFNLIKL